MGAVLSAVGIENVGGAQGRDDLTPRQLRANAWLVRDLKDRFPAIEYLNGRHEHQRFRGHALWQERDPEYLTRKQDPEDRFMGRLRSLVEDLGLKGPPDRPCPRKAETGV